MLTGIEKHLIEEEIERTKESMRELKKSSMPAKSRATGRRISHLCDLEEMLTKDLEAD